MPQLRSGRYVAVSASPYMDALSAEKDESRYFAILALRVHANSLQGLRDHLVIGYFVEGQGMPPTLSYNSGYCVADVLEGRSDEVEEFRQFLDEPRFSAWLQAQFDELDDAIRNNPVWESELLSNNLSSNDIDVVEARGHSEVGAGMERNGTAAGCQGATTRPSLFDGRGRSAGCRGAARPLTGAA